MPNKNETQQPTSPKKESTKLSDRIRSRLKTELTGGQAEQETTIPVIQETGGLFKITAGELREVCKQANPQAKDKATVMEKSVKGFADDKTVYVPRLDLQCVLDGGEVKRSTSMEGGTRVTKKEYIPPN